MGWARSRQRREREQKAELAESPESGRTKPSAARAGSAEAPGPSSGPSAGRVGTAASGADRPGLRCLLPCWLERRE